MKTLKLATWQKNFWDLLLPFALFHFNTQPGVEYNFNIVKLLQDGKLGRCLRAHMSLIIVALTTLVFLALGAVIIFLSLNVW